MKNDHKQIRLQLERKLKELEERSERLENRLSQPGEADSSENAIFHENDEVLAGLNDVTIHDIHEIRLALDRIKTRTRTAFSVCRHLRVIACIVVTPFRQ